MSGHHDFNELLREFTPKRRLRVDTKKSELVENLTLRDIRKSLEMTQQHLAELLDVNQPAVTRLENRTDMQISTLRNYIEALGGQLSIVAKFPHGDVSVNLYIDKDSSDRSVLSA